MIDTITSILSGSLILATPILLSALGEIYGESSGVINLGIEGIMNLAAFTALWVTSLTNSYILGTLAGILVGILITLIHSFSCVTIGINQLISGLLILTLANGIADFGYRRVSGAIPPTTVPIGRIMIPGLSQIPILGPILFQHNIFVYTSLLLAIIFGFILYKTTWGLKIRAVGENPVACDAAGINVNRIRYICTLLSGAMAGLGGASFTLGYIGIYGRGITAGRGWIALIVVIFSRWSPYRAILGSFIFGLGYSIASNLIGIGAGAYYYFLLMLPYILALSVMLFIFKRYKGPAALGIPYKKK